MEQRTMTAALLKPAPAWTWHPVLAALVRRHFEKSRPGCGHQPDRLSFVCANRGNSRETIRETIDSAATV